MALGLDTSEILTLTMEAALWGFSVMMFAVTVYLICRARSSREISYWNIARSSLLLLCSTIHLVASGVRVVKVFVTNAHNPGGALGYLSFAHRETIWMCTSYCFQTLIGDAIVIHRCYVVWQSIWVVVIPIALWFGTLGSLIAMLHHVIQIADGRHALSADFYMMLFFSFTLVANLVSTALLAFRIYKVNRDLSRIRATVVGSVVYPVMRTAIDAGVLYTILLIAAIVNQLKSSDPWVLPSLIVPSISIIFYMVMIRIALAQPCNQAIPTFTNSRSTTSRTGLRTSTFEHRIQLSPVDIYVSRSTTTDCSKTEQDFTNHDQLQKA